MKRILLLIALATTACAPPDADFGEAAAWESRSERVTIVRDDWGIAHVYAPTDADAVFGMMYAQAEDDFNRVETNFINAMGRLAEAEGEAEIWRDLRMKLFIDPADLQEQYESAPPYLIALMDAWADGLNYYLAKHPEVTPRVITRFEPWMALSFSEGSIGGDIERVSLGQLEAFYGSRNPAAAGVSGAGGAAAFAVPPSSGLVLDDLFAEPAGSNGIAVAPSNTTGGHALLLINPHTSFFFRSEIQVVSEEGLNAYGAVTWGQFFIYQGFNEKAGWMHTSSGVDNIDEFIETIVERDGDLYYRYGDEERPVETRVITVPYRTDDGLAQRSFTVYRTHHGPVVREADGRWVSVALMDSPLAALQQSYGRTKARNYQEFLQTMELHTNSSNNTIFADADGNIAYFHSNFVPVRDDSFDFARPVDGSDPATDWAGVHATDQAPNVLNPSNGWIQNTNNWPYSVSGATSPRRDAYPSYMDRGGENPRGLHAVRVLDGRTDFTLDRLVDAAYDSYLTAFENLIPALLRAYDAAPASDPFRARLAEEIEELRGWDLRWSAASVPTALAVFWGEQLMRTVAGEARAAGVDVYAYMATRASAAQHLEALLAASDQLAQDFGSWRTPWGDINRFQRLTADIVHPFDDAGASIPVAFTSARWGSLASFGARTHNGSKKIYGTSGNSFVAVVEFGDRVRARAVTAGGESGDPSSPHFTDQAERYATGNLRDVHFYRDDVERHAERTYHPGR